VAFDLLDIYWVARQSTPDEWHSLLPSLIRVTIRQNAVLEKNFAMAQMLSLPLPRHHGARLQKKKPGQTIDAKSCDDRLASSFTLTGLNFLSVSFFLRALPWAAECDPFRVVHFIPLLDLPPQTRDANHAN
jgi:hypothetical protein